MYIWEALANTLREQAQLTPVPGREFEIDVGLHVHRQWRNTEVERAFIQEFSRCWHEFKIDQRQALAVLLASNEFHAAYLEAIGLARPTKA